METTMSPNKRFRAYLIISTFLLVAIVAGLALLALTVYVGDRNIWAGLVVGLLSATYGIGLLAYISDLLLDYV